MTTCPGPFTKELAELNRKRDEAWQAMTPLERLRAANPHVRRGRPATMTPEQKKERRREAAKKWQAANKEKKAAYDRERRERQRQA